MISRQFATITYARNFKGVNTKDEYLNIDEGEWSEESINIFSDPQGALGSRPGFTALTSASIGATTAWCGFYQLDVHSSSVTTPNYFGLTADGKLYKYAANAYTQIYTGLATTDDDDARMACFQLENTAIIATGRNTALKYTGTGSAATFASSITTDWGLEWQRYGWLHSTVDPRLLYHGATLGDPDSAYTAFLNFDDDPGILTGAVKQGDDMLVGKEFALFRVQYRGTEPLFKKYRIPSKVGPVCFWVLKELPDGRAVFLASDCNFYMVVGDTVLECGDNIQLYIKAGVRARLKYAVAGLLYERSQYWCSFTYTSGVTTNDRTVVMDWSRPYQDAWGKLQYPWFIYTIGANCFAEVTVSGQALLYHGGYVGKMYKDDTSTNDDGAAFSALYASPERAHGDPMLEKKYAQIQLNYARQGDWDLVIQTICDRNANTEKLITENLQGGSGVQTLWDQFDWDDANWSAVSDADVVRDIDRIGKTIEVNMSTNGLDQTWLVKNFAILAKPMRKVSRSREST